MIHSFTVTFGAKYLTGMVTSVPPYEAFSLIKNNILHQSKKYKITSKIKFLRYVTFRSRGSCDIQFHKYVIQRGFLFIILLITQYPEWSDDKLRPQILSVGTTANADLTYLCMLYLTRNSVTVVVMIILYCTWIYNYLRNQYIWPLKLWVRIPLMVRCTWYNIML
jgi:cytochrome bd-type quinol oxidase subunit 2